MDSDSGSIALLAIKPRFAHAILDGEKRVEFRKVRFSQPPRYIVLYASTPIQQVIAFFEVLEIQELTVLGLWRRFRGDGAIDYHEFLAYYGRRARGCAIVVGSVWKLRRPASLRDFYPKGSPPQSFVYLRPDVLKQLMKRRPLRSK